MYRNEQPASRGGASRLLVIDDNEAIHADFQKILGGDPTEPKALSAMKEALFGKSPALRRHPTFELDFACQGQKGFEKVLRGIEERRPYCVAFVDMRMPPGWDGVETIEHIFEVDSLIQIVICTAYSDYSWSEIHEHLGHNDRLLILKKPFDNVEVSQMASALTQKFHLAQRVEATIHQLETLVEDRTSALSENESQMHTILESIGEGIVSINIQGEIIQFNSAAQSIFGYTGVDLLGKRMSDLLIPDHLRQKHRQAFERCVCSGGGPLLGQRIEMPAMHRDGRQFPIEITITPFNRNGQRCFTAILRDISERKRMEDRLRHAALHDPLTGLPNRGFFLDRLEQAVEDSKQSDRQEFAVLFLDLNRFKSINDSLGHCIGDQLLIETARRLKDCVAPGDIVARFGGDEFAILVGQAANGHEARCVAAKIIEAFVEPILLSDRQLHAEVSVGVVVASGYEHGQDMLRDADTAMYQAKSRGTACYEIFRPEMRSTVQYRLTMENELRLAIGRGELTNYYQPILSLAARRPVALEALVRWQHPDQGLLLPAHFIEVAEESGLIVPIGKCVLEAACHQFSDWSDAGTRPSIHVNISPRQLDDPQLVNQVEEILKKFDVPAEQLSLEVTEETMMQRPSAVLATLTALKSLGVRLAIDDFGTGYASLSYLHRFPFDTLKIDRSFIAVAAEHEDNWHIIDAIIILAHNLGMSAVAEGIETAEQWDRLRSLECDFGQGYYFAKPMTPEEALAFFQRGAAAHDESGTVPNTRMW